MLIQMLKNIVMKKIILPFLMTFLLGFMASAQIAEMNDLLMVKRAPEPFMFSKTTLTPEDLKWTMDYSTSYGERVSGPFGNEGVGQIALRLAYGFKL